MLTARMTTDSVALATASFMGLGLLHFVFVPFGQPPSSQFNLTIMSLCEDHVLELVGGYLVIVCVDLPWYFPVGHYVRGVSWGVAPAHLFAGPSGLVAPHFRYCDCAYS